MHNIETLHNICETLMDELHKANEKIENVGGELSSGDVEYLDKLTHALKSVKTTIAMMEADEGYSGWYMPRYAYEGNNPSTGGGQSNSNRSYARGRGRNARRDSMGRYSSARGGRGYSREDGYSYDENMDNIIEDIRGMMDDLPEDKKRKVEKLVNELEK